MPPAPPSPDRIAFLDILRGFALVGILQVNIPWQANGPCWLPGRGGGADVLTDVLRSALFELKFFTLFAFLFGYGFAISARSIEKRGLSSGPPMRRRLLGLAAFGILHAVFLFIGDILLTYAAAGIVLIVARDWSDRRIVQVIALCLVLSACGGGLISLFMAANPALAFDHASCAAAERIYRGGDFFEVAGQRVNDSAGVILVIVMALQGPMIVAAFLSGRLAQRRGLLAPGWSPDPRWARLAWVLAPVLLGIALLQALAFQRVIVPAPALAALVGAGAMVTAPFLSIVIALAVWALRNTRVMAGMAVMGRMSLTIYIGESLVTSLLFSGYGFGLFGTLGSLELAGVALLIMAGLHLFALLWTRHVGQGPLERLLRQITYGGAVTKASTGAAS